MSVYIWHPMDVAGVPVLRRINRPNDTGESGGGGTPPPSDPDRSLLVYGTYEPDQSTAGVIAGSTLTDYNSSSTVAVNIPDGAVITNKRIYGEITHLGSATITNCRIYGGPGVVSSGNTACIKAFNTRTGQAVYTDCTIVPQTQSNGRDCILGRQYELYRCYLAQGVDGAGIYSNTSAHPGADVTIMGCVIEDLSYTYPDNITTRTDGSGTHNDCIQIQGGKNIWIKGNSIRGTAHKMAGSGTSTVNPWMIDQGWTSGACIVVQDNVSGNTWGAIDNTTVIEQNWIYGGGGGSQINIKTNVNFIYRNNRHYRATAIGSGWAGYWIRGDNLASNNITGIDVAPTGNNLWIDGPYAGTALTSPRDKGIHSNTGNY